MLSKDLIFLTCRDNNCITFTRTPSIAFKVNLQYIEIYFICVSALAKLEAFSAVVWIRIRELFSEHLGPDLDLEKTGFESKISLEVVKNYKIVILSSLIQIRYFFLEGWIWIPILEGRIRIRFYPWRSDADSFNISPDPQLCFQSTLRRIFNNIYCLYIYI